MCIHLILDIYQVCSGLYMLLDMFIHMWPILTPKGAYMCIVYMHDETVNLRRV